MFNKNMYKNNRDIIVKMIGFGVLIIMALIIVVLSTMKEGEQLLNEGVAKAVPLVKEDKLKKLGDLYIKLNDKFEREIEDFEMAEAPITNKVGEKLHYGVNGRENHDDLINEDYVNGIIVNYDKGGAYDRKDGESNFIDMVSFLSSVLGADIDNYEEEKLEEIFTYLFDLTHTFSGEATELYPCDHGCRWSKYYCGDSRVQGTVNGNTVGFYKMDEYMGEKGKYGMMYDPFLVHKSYHYPNLTEITEDVSKFKTSFMYNTIKVIPPNPDDEDSKEVHVITKLRGNVEGDSMTVNELIQLVEPSGYCPICSEGKSVTSTTKEYGGCCGDYSCLHGECIRMYEEDDEEGHLVDGYLGEDKGDCDNPIPERADCTCEDEPTCKPPLYDKGYYVCGWHTHYACPGHILVYCMGHTNLNLTIKIMYHEEMVKVIHDLIK